jgi:hypothetical protein
MTECAFSYNCKTVLISDLFFWRLIVATLILRYTSIVWKKNLRNRKGGRKVMLRRIFLFAGALCVSSYALAASPSIIGSVTARGEAKIDNQEVQGSGTLFDGSVIETGQSVSSEADLRLTNNAVVTLLRDSRGTLYRDRFVLERGRARLGLTDSFRIQANDVMVVPTEEHSSGIVSIDEANLVTVEAKNGTLEVRNSSGVGVARVQSGNALSFSAASGKSPTEFSATGTVSSENGHYYLNSAETCMKYEVKGDDLKSYEGTSVVASGVLQPAAPATGVAGLLVASSIRSSGAAYTLPGQSAQFRSLVGGLSILKGRKIVETAQCPPDPFVDCCPGIPFPQCCDVPLPPSQCSHSQ